MVALAELSDKLAGSIFIFKEREAIQSHEVTKIGINFFPNVLNI